MRTTTFMDRYGAAARTIARQNFPEVGQPRGCPVALDQPGNVQPAAPLAAGTGNLQHGHPAGEFSQRDRAAAVHRRRFFASAAPWRDLGFGAAGNAVGRDGPGSSLARIARSLRIRGDSGKGSVAIVLRSRSISAALSSSVNSTGISSSAVGMILSPPASPLLPRCAVLAAGFVLRL
jgi:hypothetical protein